MREHRTAAGKLMYYATRAELESLPGYRGSGDRGRACCPIHNGDNPTALSIDWATGWAHCFSCGDAWAIRVEDHPDAITPRGDGYTKPIQNQYSGPQNRPRATQSRRRDPEPVAHDLGALQATLEHAIAGAMDALPGSPGQRYLASRGIPLDVALSLGIGWGRAGELGSRVVFPLSGPDGHPTSATGRRIYETDNERDPKYKALDRKAGYVKTLFNGGAIAWARRTAHPLIIVEGPLDAAACAAAGLPLAVAIGSTSYRYPEHFDGVSTAILALDSDDAGQEGRRRLCEAFIARGIDVLSLPASALDGAKDLGEYWQRHHAMPAMLTARAIGPHLPRSTATPPADWATPANPDNTPTEGAAAAGLAFDDLPPALRAEADALAVELAADTSGDLYTDFVYWLSLCTEATLSAEDRVAAQYAVDLASRLIVRGSAA